MQPYLPGVPADQVQLISDGMKRPAGTLIFVADYPALLEPTGAAGVLFQVVAGRLVWILHRDSALALRYIHSSPSIGTREAMCDLNTLRDDKPCRRFILTLTWSPTEMMLRVSRIDGGAPLEATGRYADFSLEVADDGTLHEFGGKGVSLISTRLYSDGTQILGPSAIRLWAETQVAADLLLKATSERGDEPIFGVIVCNAIVSALVTGFEGYCRQRFVEMEDEGIAANFPALARRFLGREERERMARGEDVEILAFAKKTGVSPLKAMVERRYVNFQSFDEAKDAFNRGYRIVFGRLGSLSAQDFESVRRLIQYRHRVAHVSPLLGVLNWPDIPERPAVLAGKDTATEAIRVFSAFVEALHAATLGAGGTKC